MNEVMGQEANGFIPVGLANDAPLDSSCEAGKELLGRNRTAGATPVDGIHMGVDLEKAWGGGGDASIRERGQCPDPQARQVRDQLF